MPAQEVSAGIIGVVTDPSGAAIVGASVGAKEVTRGTSYTTQTNAEGVYFFPRVPGGVYDLTVEAQGFRTHIQSGIALEVNQRARINVAMQLGAVTETVEVTGEIPLLNTDFSGSVSLHAPVPGAPRPVAGWRAMAPGSPSPFATRARARSGCHTR